MKRLLRESVGDVRERLLGSPSTEQPTTPAFAPPPDDDAEARAIREAQERLERARAEAPSRAAGPPPVIPSAPRPVLAPVGALGASIARAAARYRVALDQRSPEWEQERARLAAMEHARRARDLRRAAAARGVPEHPGILSVILAERPLPTGAWRAVEDAFAWRQRQTRPGFPSPPVTLVLAGKPGRGKSATLARMVATSRSAFFCTARDIATLPESGWSEHTATRRHFISVRLLAIDEAGLEEAARAGARMEAILSERINNGLATLISTNMSFEDFSARYMNDRLLSRLGSEQSERGQPWWADCMGDDLRDPQALASAGWAE